MGVGLEARGPSDMWKEGVVAPLRVARQAVLSAAEAAVMILRIDDVIAAKHKGAQPGHGGGLPGDA